MPTTKSVEVIKPKLVGNFQTDICGKSLVMDGCGGGLHIYNLPIVENIRTKDSSDGDVDDNGKSVTIPDCQNLNFDLLKGYVPLKDGGNRVSDCGIYDRTAGIRWLIKHHEDYKCNAPGARLFDIDFFAGNRAIRSVMTSQFSPYKVFIGVILFRGTYFNYDVSPDMRKECESNNKKSFGGLRFEDHITRKLDGTEGEPSPGEKNNYVDSINYYNVVRFNFDIFKMLLFGEVDCVLPGTSAATGEKAKAGDFVEIKTSAPLENKHDPTRMRPTFCSKACSWYAKCVLMGIKHIVVGIRDKVDNCNTMTVRRTQSFTLDELRQRSNGFWSESRCFGELKKFLNLVKKKVTEDDPQIINVFAVKGGRVSEPEKKKLEDDRKNLPDISEVVEIMKKM